MGSVKLLKNTYPQNVVISSNGLTFNTNSGYGIATSSLSIKKHIKQAAYLEVKVTAYSGLCAAMVLLGGNAANWFSINAFNRVNMYYQAEVLNGSRTDAAIMYPTITSGQTIGIVLDPLGNAMLFYINGALYKKYSAKRVDFSKVEGEDIRFNVGVDANSSLASEFTVNFGASPFKYPIPEGCISYEKAVSYYAKNLLYLKDNAVYGIQ